MINPNLGNSDIPVIEHLQPTGDWIDSSKEEALDPSLPIVDAHHHFSQHWGGYGPSDLIADKGGHNIVSTVYIQCGWGYRDVGPEPMQPVGETECILRAAKGITDSRTQVAAGIVGHADLRLGRLVSKVLAAHIDAGGCRFRGIRHSGAFHPSFRHGILARAQQGLYSDTQFREGFSQLAKFGLSFDAWVYHPQLDEVCELASAFPETQIVLDHIGGVLGVAEYRGDPARAQHEWLPAMKRLAQRPNVYVKLGGFGTAVFGYGFSAASLPPSSEIVAAAFAPWIRPVIELFGPDRCMFESNFPVDRAISGYGVLWNAFKRVIADASQSERQKLFHDTASAVYRL